MDISLLRELVDAAVRPGQPQGSLAVHRQPRTTLLVSSRPVGINRYDWSQSISVRGALYGRARYGGHRYLAAT